MKHLSIRNIPGLALPLVLVAATLTLQGPQAKGYGIGFVTEGRTLGHPVHQVVTQAAVEDSGLLDSEATQSKRDEVMKHILEGVVFNDDPDGYSLRGTPLFESGHPEVKFAMIFVKFNGIDEDPEKTSATEQSHFGDFQFMHAMGSGSESDLNLSETREVIRGRILGYMRHVWRLYREEDSLKKLIHRYSIIKPKTLEAKKLQKAGAIEDFRDADALEKKYPNDFGRMSSYDNFLWWSMAIFNLKVLTFHADDKSAEGQDQYRNRAVGTMLHIIQDSYAKGHVVREGWEKDNSGPIIHFQDYSQQHAKAHDAHDKHKGKVSATNYHEIPGARMAKLQSTKLLTMLKNNCPWDNKSSDAQMSVANCPTTVADFLTNDVFAFSKDPNLSPGDSITRSHKSLEKRN